MSAIFSLKNSKSFTHQQTGLGNIVINDDGVVINGKVFMKENLFVTNLQSPEVNHGLL